MKFKFNVGDQVRVLDGSKIPYYTGGWVSDDRSEHIGCEYRIESRGIHSAKGYPCYSLVGDWHTWDERGLELADLKRKKEKITVYRDGNKVVAIDQRTGKEGIAHCHPDDEFDFSVGAALAFDRLMGRVKDAIGKPVADPPAKFKVGDRVIGNDQADKHYGITTQGWIGTVKEVFDNERISVQGSAGDTYTVQAECFDLYTGFLVGDQVKVIDTGRMFSTRIDWIIDHVHDVELIAKYAYGDSPYSDGKQALSTTFTVRCVDTKEQLAYIQDGDWRCYLIRWNGIERV